MQAIAHALTEEIYTGLPGVLEADLVQEFSTTFALINKSMMSNRLPKTTKPNLQAN